MSNRAWQGPDLIPIRIANISQLFHSLDPLNKDTEEFIISWARELPADRPFTVVVHLPEEQLTLPDAQEISTAIKQFFAYRAQVIGLALKELLRVWTPLTCYRPHRAHPFDPCQVKP